MFCRYGDVRVAASDSEWKRWIDRKTDIQYRSKKVNVSTVRYAPGALLVRSWCTRGSLLVLSWYARVRWCVRCGAVRFGAVCSWCALGALLVHSRFALGTLLVRSSSVVRAVRACSAVRFGAVGAVRSAYYRLCAHARSCARLGFVHVADSCDVAPASC